MEIAKILVSQTTGRCIIKKHIPAGLVGGTVSVKYEDPIWDRLVKTVIFRGTAVKAADNFDGETAVIPWEVLEHPGPYLFFGIWGSDPDSALQLPLIEVRIGPIEDATDPTADPGTDPTLPIWAQLKEEIERLKQDGVSEEKIAQIVEDYLAKNPPKVTEEDPTVPEWAKQPEKPEYTAEEVGAISEDNLQGAVNTALAQAKESGEFDGEPGKDYVLTPEDKAEIAEMAADLVEVPDSGGIGLGVTGAEVGQTVKISAVDENGVPTAWEPVEFPSGGNSETAAELLLATGTIATGTEARTYIDTGVPLAMLKQYKRFVVIFDGASNVETNNVYLRFTSNTSISRISAGGWVCGYEWVNKNTNLLRLYGYYEGNPSLVTTGRNYVTGNVPNLLATSITGKSGIWLSDLSTISESDTLKFYLSDATTIDYTWEVRGLTV